MITPGVHTPSAMPSEERSLLLHRSPGRFWDQEQNLLLSRLHQGWGGLLSTPPSSWRGDMVMVSDPGCTAIILRRRRSNDRGAEG